MRRSIPVIAPVIALAPALAAATFGLPIADEPASLSAESASRRVLAQYDDATGSVAAARVEVRDAEASAWTPAPDEAAETLASSIAGSGAREVIPLIAALTAFDCNLNGVPDAIEIAAGAQDLDVDGVLDSCEFAMGDLNLNGMIDQQDVSILLGWWGIANPAFGDLDHDGAVSAADLGILLSRFGVVTY